MQYLLLICAVFGSGQIPPEFAQNLTVYHLNPLSAGALPVNMNTGDAQGDLYFYLGQFLLPLECKNASRESRATFDCDNAERRDPSLVVTQVNLEVDVRTTTYSACNLCNGTDPFTGGMCERGTYICNCFGARCRRNKVGKMNVTKQFAPNGPTEQCTKAFNESCGHLVGHKALCSLCTLEHFRKLQRSGCKGKDVPYVCNLNPWFHGCNSTSPEWTCWAENIVRKTGGLWYSTLREGQCQTGDSSTGCSWRSLTTKSVREPCLKGQLMAAVEAFQPNCFEACGPRNTTSNCWISCFFDAILGPAARHSVSEPLTGIPLPALERAWENAFLPEALGGCPSVKTPALASTGTAELVV